MRPFKPFRLRWFRTDWRRPRPAILMYHRVAEVPHDPWGLAVSPKRFEEQMTYISQSRTVMRLEDLVQRLAERNLPRDAIAVTFDDAYQDNLVNAHPVLAKYQVPACVFVPTGYIGRDRPFWWDELAAMVLPCTRSIALDHVCHGVVISLHWDATTDAELTKDGWRAWDPPRTARQGAYHALWQTLQQSTEEEREAVLEYLRDHVGVKPDSLSFPMSESELSAILQSGLVCLGAHSVTHPRLTKLSLSERRTEIERSYAQCQSFTTQPVKGFAYPYGDMNPDVCNEVQKAGLSYACSTQGEFLDAEKINRFALPRLAIGDVPLRSFIKSISD